MKLISIPLCQQRDLEENNNMRDFKMWLNNFENTIASWRYYTDFEKAYENVNKIKNEINLLNRLIGSKNIDNDFEELLNEHPNVLKALPILLATRSNKVIPIKDAEKDYNYDFRKKNITAEEIKDYTKFMRETGVFDLLENHLVDDLTDYIIGVEVGMDTNARKNRTGDAMEDVVESFIAKAGYVKNENYFKEVSTDKIKETWGIDLSEMLNKIDTTAKNKKVKLAKKRFDFVIEESDVLYLIETNFYNVSGSKLNETARSYKMLSEEIGKIKNLNFIWITDGKGWDKARNNLEETFNVLDTLYNINDLKNGIFVKLRESNKIQN